jgi:hypothetical protein
VFRSQIVAGHKHRKFKTTTVFVSTDDINIARQIYRFFSFFNIAEHRTCQQCPTLDTFAWPKILLPVGVLLCLIWYFLVRICIATHKQQQVISTQSNISEWTHMLLMYMPRSHMLLMYVPRSHMHSFCATSMRSGLATRVTLTQVSLVGGETGTV